MRIYLKTNHAPKKPGLSGAWFHPVCPVNIPDSSGVNWCVRSRGDRPPPRPLLCTNGLGQHQMGSLFPYRGMVRIRGGILDCCLQGLFLHGESGWLGGTLKCNSVTIVYWQGFSGIFNRNMTPLCYGLKFAETLASIGL